MTKGHPARLLAESDVLNAAVDARTRNLVRPAVPGTTTISEGREPGDGPLTGEGPQALPLGPRTGWSWGGGRETRVCWSCNRVDGGGEGRYRGKEKAASRPVLRVRAGWGKTV